MSDQPLVSIITPCYNGERFLKRYFESVINQTYDNIELIFINDGSEDRTDKIVREYEGRIKDRGYSIIYLVQENSGQAAALNCGLKHFAGEYLAWLDADDLLLPQSVEKRVKYLRDHPEIHMVRTDGWIAEPGSDHYKHTIADDLDKFTKDIFEELLKVETYGCNGCYMISAEVFLASYPNRDIFVSSVGQNWQLLVPAASRTKCGYIDEPLYVLNEHNDSHSRREQTNQDNYDRWKSFTEVLDHALKVSECDYEKYRNLIMHQMYEQHFYIAVNLRDRKMLKETYTGMKQYGTVAGKQKVLFLKSMITGN